jgi:hypothetical protein
VVLVQAAVQHGLDGGDRSGLRIQRKAESSSRRVNRGEVRDSHHRPGIFAQTNGGVGAPERDDPAGKPAFKAILGQPDDDVVLGLAITPCLNENFSPLYADHLSEARHVALTQDTREIVAQRHLKAARGRIAYTREGRIFG